MWVNRDIVIEFYCPLSVQNLIDILEKLDAEENYAYFNYAEALDAAAKELVYRGIFSQQQWDALNEKYGGGG